MVSAINFAVRTSAGTTQLGSVAGEGQSNLIAVQPGQSVSLNLSPGSVVAYRQEGKDLIVQLTDGRTVVLSDYFAAPAGMENKLYLSANDEILEVRVANGVDGVLFADYGPMQAMEKWSPLDNLRFSESDVLSDTLVASNEPAGMAMLVPGLLAGGGAAAGVGGLGTAAALAGGALLLGAGGAGGSTGSSTGSSTGNTGTSTGGGGTGGGGAGGGGTTYIPPTVDPRAATTLNTTTNNPSLVVSGTGQPGDRVVVTVGGVPTTTTITPGGTWSISLTGPNLPRDGTYVPTVVVTNPATGTTTNLSGSTYVIDMTPPTFSVDTGTVSNGFIHNIASYAASGGNTVISGRGEAGATMTVNANGHTQTAVVAANGTWSVSFTQAQLPHGDFRQVPVQIRATDVNGNVSAVFNTNVAIDTVANAINLSTVAGDGTVNFVESRDGFTITGTSVAGQQVTVNLGNGITQTVTVGANGQWSASFAGGQITQNGAASFTVSSTDPAGNPNVRTFNYNVDTQASAAVNTAQGFGASINALEAAAAAGVNITGRADANSTVVVAFEGQTRTVTANASGDWTANFNLSHLVGANAVERTGTINVTATDPFGNVAVAAPRLVNIDTLAPIDPFVTGDAGNNLAIPGVITAGNANTYTFHAVAATGAPQQLAVLGTVDILGQREDGNFVQAKQTNFTTAVPDGTYLVIRDVDAAGNESSTLYLRSGNEVTVDLNRAGLQGFDFGTINLVSADANVTLTTQNVLALTGADKQITVTGTADDVVNLVGGTLSMANGAPVTSNINGETYRLYTLGSGATALIDDDIRVNLAP